jgi:hypothetical protein
MPARSPTPTDTRRWLAEQGINPDSVEGRWLAALLTYGEPATENAPAPPAEEPNPAA